MIPQLCPFELEIKMADKDEIFRKCRRKTPEWMADFEKLCFSLELESEREGNSDSQELEDFISAQKSSNTVKNTKSDIRALKWFSSTIDETREPETMTAKELDKLLF